MLMAVIKANAYGHGAVEVAQAAIAAGAAYLGVAFADEAINLRQNGVPGRILILGYTPPSSIEEVIKHDLTITVFTAEVMQAIVAKATLHKRMTTVHLKVDTGMSRVGVTSPQEAHELATLAANSDYVTLEGVFTHFAEADEIDSVYTWQQYEQFISTLHYLEAQGITVPIKHCCNTAATIGYPQMHLDMVRVGVGLYGHNPFGNGYGIPKLRETMRFVTRVVDIRKSEGIQSIAGEEGTATRRELVVAVLPVGYADGLFPTLAGGKGSVILRGNKLAIVGDIGMDETLVDVTSVPDVELGDEVILFGWVEKAAEDEVVAAAHLTVQEYAEKAGTICYEAFCAINKRVPRVYTN
jgi:alanine racemase